MVDIPTSVNGYHADQTRTYIAGEADNEKRDMHAKLKEIADHVIENMKPGMICGDIYRMAVEKSESINAADAFLSFGGGTKCKMIGHGIGLEVNEPPIINVSGDMVISENYVIALELHMLREKIGVMKLEDTILIGKNQNEILTQTPRELTEIPLRG